MEPVAEHLSEWGEAAAHTELVGILRHWEPSLQKESIFPSLLATQLSLSLSYKIKVVLICMVHDPSWSNILPVPSPLLLPGTLCSSNASPWTNGCHTFVLPVCAVPFAETLLDSLCFFVFWKIPVYLSKRSWVPLPLGKLPLMTPPPQGSLHLTLPSTCCLGFWTWSTSAEMFENSRELGLKILRSAEVMWHVQLLSRVRKPKHLLLRLWCS